MSKKRINLTELILDDINNNISDISDMEDVILDFININKEDDNMLEDLSSLLLSYHNIIERDYLSDF